MSGFLNKIYNQFNHIQYGLTKPQSLIVLVPLVAQYVQNIQLQNIHRPRRSEEVMVYAERVDPINTYHCLGALARSIAWIALSFFTGNFLFSICAMPSLYQAYYSQKRLLHQYQISPESGFIYTQIT